VRSVRRIWRNQTLVTIPLVGLLVGLSSCSLSSPEALVVAEESTAIGAPAVEPAEPNGRQTPVDPSTSSPVNTGSGSSDPLPDDPLSDDEVAEILADLTEQGFCDPADVEDDGTVTAMHFVVRGELQDPCFVDQGDDETTVDPVVVDDDPRLLAAWDVLTEIAPIELVADISLLAGYEPCSDCDSLAFVSQLDEAGTFFLVAVDVVAATEDPDELRLTMMHELTHVFAQVPGEQLVVSSSSAGCETYYNAVGCLTGDSYLWAWIQEFWPPDVLATLPLDGSPGTTEEADARCAADPAYTGSYAAIHPEEDFAEAFSAYVFDVEVDPALTPKFEFFDRYPEFVAIRESARAAGYSGTPANFDGCGR
jgi:hypothetical protein